MFCRRLPGRPESDQICPAGFFKTKTDENDQPRLFEFDEKRFKPKRHEPLRPDFDFFAYQTRHQKRRQRWFCHLRKNLHNSDNGDLPA